MDAGRTEQSHALQLSYFKLKSDEPFQAHMEPKLPMFPTEGRGTTLLTLSQSCSRIVDTQENDPNLAAVFDGSNLRSLSMLSLRNKIHGLDTSKTTCKGNSCGASGSYLLVKV